MRKEPIRLPQSSTGSVPTASRRCWPSLPGACGRRSMPKTVAARSVTRPYPSTGNRIASTRAKVSKDRNASSEPVTQSKKGCEMSDQQRLHARIGFAHVALAFATRTLSEDEAVWDLVGPPNCGDLSVTDILDHLRDSDEIMSEALARVLDLPHGSTYAAGVRRVREDYARGRSSPLPAVAQGGVARAHGRTGGSDAADSHQAALVRELERLTDESKWDLPDW